MGGDEEARGSDGLDTRRHAPKSRLAFWLCFMSALLFTATSLAAAVYFNALRLELFERGVMQNVDFERQGIDEASARRFASETIAYLRGERLVWSPTVIIRGEAMPIPDSFTAHMATVKGWTSGGGVALAAGLALSVALLAWALLLGRRLRGSDGLDADSGLRDGDGLDVGSSVRDDNGSSARNTLRGGLHDGKPSLACGFSTRGWYAGALAPVALLIALGLWACLNFDGMWAWLHRTFIPDGIFSASEPVMLMFPAELFAGYLAPVGLSFGALAACVMALPWALRPLSAAICRERRG